MKRGVGGAGRAGQGDHGGRRGSSGSAVGFRGFQGFAGGAQFLRLGEVLGFDLGEDEEAGPVDQEGQQEDFKEEDGESQQAGEGLEQAGAGAVALVGGDDVLELQAGLADQELVVMGQANDAEEGFVVALQFVVGGKPHEEDAVATFFETGMVRGDLVVVREHQVAVAVASDQGDGLADHKAFALVASG